jgi:hypothetical protein
MSSAKRVNLALIGIRNRQTTWVFGIRNRQTPRNTRIKNRQTPRNLSVLVSKTGRHCGFNDFKHLGHVQYQKPADIAEARYQKPADIAAKSIKNRQTLRIYKFQHVEIIGKFDAKVPSERFPLSARARVGSHAHVRVPSLLVGKESDLTPRACRDGQALRLSSRPSSGRIWARSGGQSSEVEIGRYRGV